MTTNYKKVQREAMTTNSEEGTERNDEYIVKKVQREMMNIDSEESRQEGTLSKHKKV